MLAVAGVLVVLAAALALDVRGTVARARAQAAADLSAIAGARQAQRAEFGEPVSAEPCTRAREVAEHDGARLSTCQESPGARVLVEVVVRTPLGDARADALAGPQPP